MANNRQKFLSDQDIEMVEMESLDIQLSDDFLETHLVQTIRRALDFNLIAELERIPARHYDNIDTTNLDRSIKVADIWNMVYSMLDVKSILQLSMSCKLLAEIANAGTIREKIYKEKNAPINMNLDVSLWASLQQQYQIQAPVIPQGMHHFFHVPQAQVVPMRVPAPPAEIYHDEPEGWGFVMRNNYASQ